RARTASVFSYPPIPRPSGGSWITRLTVRRPASYGPIPHYGAARVTRSPRGRGKPGHEPDGSGKTGRSSPEVRDESTPGAVPRRVVRQAKGGVPLERRREPLPTRVMDTPPLPTAYDAALRDGLSAIPVALSAEARAAIDGHVRLLLAWTESINLTGIREPAAVALGHVVDSLTGRALIAAATPQGVLDLGSGGGSPGIPLAASLRDDRPDLEVTLRAPSRHKDRILHTAVPATRLDRTVRVVAGRAEDLAGDPPTRSSWDVVTARALAATA